MTLTKLTLFLVMFVNRVNGGPSTAVDIVIEEENDSSVVDLKNSVIEDVEFLTGHSYLKTEICWICKDSYSTKPTIQPCHCPSSTGLAHPACLIDWMNAYCKGRCPRCAVMFMVKTEQRPRKLWEPDPMLQDKKTKYIVMVTLNLVVTVVCFASIGHLIHTETEERTPARVAVAAVIGVVFVVYVFYQSRLYVRIYERLKIYNNKVIEVYEWEEESSKGAVERHNLSSYIDQSELN